MAACGSWSWIPAPRPSSCTKKPTPDGALTARLDANGGAASAQNCTVRFSLAGAGKLIDDAGLKGTRIGGAVVSDRHANFIIAEPECTSQDVLRLIDLIRGQVRDRLGVELELELEIW